MTLTWTTLTADVTPQWAALSDEIARHDDTDEFYSAEDLAEELVEHGFDAESDSWAVWDGDQLVAYGQLRVSPALTAEGYARAGLGGGVHPRWRGRGLGSELVARMQPRAVALANERFPGAPVQLRAQGGKEGDPARALLADLGFEPVRYFTDMARSLPGEPLPAPADHRLRPFTTEVSEAVRDAHNDAFATHWGSTAQSPERWADMVSSRSFRAGTSRVLVEDGVVLAYALCGQWVDRELYVSLVGTRQAARGRGLARTVLTATVADAAASGDYDLVDLGVDSSHPSGADALYRSIGFSPVRTTAAYAKLA